MPPYRLSVSSHRRKINLKTGFWMISMGCDALRMGLTTSLITLFLICMLCVNIMVLTSRMTGCLLRS